MIQTKERKMTSVSKRERFATALVSADDRWAEIFADTPFADLAYSDMLLRLWQQGEKAVRKTDLYQDIRYVSYGTSVKYIQQAVDKGLILEQEDPDDRRVRRVKLSQEAKAKVESWLDFAIKAFKL